MSSSLKNPLRLTTFHSGAGGHCRHSLPQGEIAHICSQFGKIIINPTLRSQPRLRTAGNDIRRRIKVAGGKGSGNCYGEYGKWRYVCCGRQPARHSDGCCPRSKVEQTQRHGLGVDEGNGGECHKDEEKKLGWHTKIAGKFAATVSFSR